MLYLMTDRNNYQFVDSIMKDGWSGFPHSINDSVKIHTSKPLCELVIFENKKGLVLGFAKTKDFLLNLYQIRNRKRSFESALNYNDSDFITYAANHLVSFSKSANGSSLEDVGMSMIRENISQTVSDIESGRYYLNLSSLFELK